MEDIDKKASEFARVWVHSPASDKFYWKGDPIHAERQMLDPVVGSRRPNVGQLRSAWDYSGGYHVSGADRKDRKLSDLRSVLGDKDANKVFESLIGKYANVIIIDDVEVSTRKLSRKKRLLLIGR